MAIDIKYDFVAEDVVIENGDLVLIDGLEELRQRVVMKLRTFSREMWLSPFNGIPYLRPRPTENIQIIGRIVSLDDVASIFTDAVLEEPEITSVDTMDLNYDRATRQLSIFIKATANEDLLIIEAVL